MHEPEQIQTHLLPPAKDDHVIFIGNRAAWGGEALFGLHATDRRRHVFVVGQTGTGKSALLKNIAIQEVHADRGCALIDPHGDLAEELLDHIPPSRVKDVVLLDASDFEYPVSFNLLAHADAEERHLIAANIVSSFKSAWKDSWGPRLEFLLFNAIAALLECENVSLLALPRLLRDQSYRDWVLRQVEDPVVRAFWAEYASYDPRYRREIVMPIENKVGQLLSPVIRNLLGQVRNRIDLRKVMDRRRIFIAKLSKGRIGQSAANLLGALLVTQFQQAALSRADTPEDERVDFNLIVDEFANFTTDSFVSMLSETRKYRLGLTVAAQYLDQAPPDVLNALLGNVGTILSFRVSEKDAAVLSRHIGGHYDPTLFSNLDNYQVVAKVLRGGRYADPFLARTLPPLAMNYNRGEKLIRYNRQRYAAPRQVVEEKIRRWMNQRYN
jgi:type IV secretory pathway TraG/TraD family ATPase VirD4